MLKIPNPVAYTCRNCGEPAVVAEFATGLHPVHCGTYREACPSQRTPRGSGRRGEQTVSPPPAVLTGGGRRFWPRRRPRLDELD